MLKRALSFSKEKVTRVYPVLTRPYRSLYKTLGGLQETVARTGQYPQVSLFFETELRFPRCGSSCPRR